MLFLLALGLTMGSVIGCGGPGAITGGTQPGTYTLSVVGTSTLGSGETLSHSAPMTLTVKALD
jgi:hypothetical protein